MATQFSRERAQKIADGIVSQLGPYCKRKQDGSPYIEVAGSLRRRRQWVHDIDIVLVPGDSLKLYQTILTLNWPYKPKPDGPKIKKLSVGGVAVDLYICEEKDWATLLLIRTGSAKNNIRLCMRSREKFWQLHADGSGLFDQDGKRIAGDTELSIYNALGLKYQEPWERE